MSANSNSAQGVLLVSQLAVGLFFLGAHRSGNRKPWVKNEGRYPKVWHKYLPQADTLRPYTAVDGDR